MGSEPRPLTAQVVILTSLLCSHSSVRKAFGGITNNTDSSYCQDETNSDLGDKLINELSF